MFFINSQLNFAFLYVLPNLQPRPPQRSMDMKIGRLRLFTVFHKLSEADVDYFLQKQGPLAKGIRLVSTVYLLISINSIYEINAFSFFVKSSYHSEDVNGTEPST